MKPVIEALWNGNIAPGEACGVGDPEIEELVMLLERNRETLDRELEARQKTVFTQYAACVEEYTCLISARVFSDGFSLACKLLTEALAEKI